MKKTNIIIFAVVLLVIIAIFGFAIWDANQDLNKLGENSDNGNNGITQNEVIRNQENQNATMQNEIQGNTAVNESGVNVTTQGSNTDYVGIWYINKESYSRSERIENIMDTREDNTISEEEFQREMQSEANKTIVELDVEEYLQNRIKFDLEVTSPAPSQREGKLDDIVVDVNNGVGTFTYTDNWGTSGNGTIKLRENKIELKLETTKAAQGAQWGVEGVYTFMYKLPN